MKPSAITAPSKSAMRGRSVKLLPFVPDIFAPVHAAQFVQRAEDLVRQRHDDVVDFFDNCFTSMFRSFGRVRTERQACHSATVSLR